MSIFAEFSLPVTAFPPSSRLTEDPDISAELERIVPTGSVTHYLWFVGGEYDRAIEHLRTDAEVESLDVLDEFDDRVLVRIHWKRLQMPVFDLIEETGGLLVEATGTAAGWDVALRFPSQDALARFYSECRQRGITLELRGINESGFGEQDGDYGLTSAQRETVEAAFQAGYFEVPRQTTLAALAEELGVSEQAVSERLRRGLLKFLTATLKAPDSH
ncbi:helix-turn-helix domain-containing protein [Halomarina salina]|uniref:Helix-turn-helix domain-containing protein n=1 Tax=Halomarina salina TaxID=1872699 RepID=A0ABD5RP21_9EURY|nr:helix-turn-helix domain-containing protein [Halomarina salina]